MTYEHNRNDICMPESNSSLLHKSYITITHTHTHTHTYIYIYVYVYVL